MRTANRLLRHLVPVAAIAAAAQPASGADPSLYVCMGTEALFEGSECPAASPDPVSRFFNETWSDFGPQTATAHDAVSASWSVLSAESSIYARYGAVVTTGFSNDHNSGTAQLDASDFVIDGPPGPVTFTLNVFVTGAIHASSTDAQRFRATAGLNVTGTIFKTLAPVVEAKDTCPMTIAGGNVDATSASGYGIYADHIGGPALFTSDPCQVNTGEPFRIRLNLGLGASLVTPFAYDLPEPGAEGSAWSRFSASFPSSGPVFNLPVGYTASSATAQVFDNGYLPEPGQPALAAAALLALAGSARSRCSRSGAAPRGAQRAHGRGP